MRYRGNAVVRAQDMFRNRARKHRWNGITDVSLHIWQRELETIWEALKASSFAYR